MKKYKHAETSSIRIQTPYTLQKEHRSPLYLSSSFKFDSAEEARGIFADEIQGNMYTRFSNPNNDEFIAKLIALEGVEDGEATASGMSAIFLSLAAFLRAGDHLLASQNIFGSTHQIITQVLPRWGISHTYVNLNDPESWEENILPTTKMIFLETPSNPALDIIDLEWLGKLAEKYNLLLNIDNTFATPYLQNPAKFGADLVTHSATKFIDGQGRVIAGAVLGKGEYIKEVRTMARQTGPTLSPFHSWLLSKSLETLPIRMERHCSNALALAEYLEKNNEVISVKYPFLPSYPLYKLAKKQMLMGGGMVSFEIKGDNNRCMKLLNNLKMISLTANLGDSKTSITHPATTTHSKLSPDEREETGISEGLLRVSVGLEHINDIIEDIDQAIQKSK